MASETSLSEQITPTPLTVDRHLQVRLKAEDGKLLLLLPPENAVNNADNPTNSTSWFDLWQQLKLRLNGAERFWQPQTEVHLMAHDRLLDMRQLQSIAEALSEVELLLRLVNTSRRQTAVAAVTAGYSVEQTPPLAPLTPLESPGPQVVRPMAAPLYLQMTVRSGVEIRHPGTVVILGDINPGGSVIAEGDILVWGRLRGLVHAGVTGNVKSLIMALQMEPTLIRIADSVARSPENPPAQYHPEVAYLTAEGIRITKATNFDKSQLLAD